MIFLYDWWVYVRYMDFNLSFRVATKKDGESF